MNVSARIRRYVGHGFLWLLVIALFPIGLLIFLDTLVRAAFAAAIVAAFIGAVFLLAYLNRNSPASKLLRSATELSCDTPAAPEKPLDQGRQDV